MAKPYTADEVLDIVHKVCAEVSDGKSVRQVFKELGNELPDRRIFTQWIADDHNGVRAIYEAAIRERAHAFAEEMIDIADEMKDAKTSEQIAAARLRIETRKWNAARMMPKIYGDKVQQVLTGADDGPIKTEAIVNVEAGEAYLRMINGGA